MALNDFSVFNSDGSGELVLPEPHDHGYDPAPKIDIDGNGATIFAREGVASWYFGTDPADGDVLTTAQYYALLGKRSAAGRIRFRTRHPNGGMVQLFGTIDLYPPVTILRDLAFGVAIEFTRVVAV